MLFEFSKYVDRRSVEESIFISPAIGAPEFRWRGRRVEVRFPDPLRDNITYVITVGTDVEDLRNRNRMAEAFSLAFSTGSTLDSALILGKVFDQKPEGVTIFAYHLDRLDPDTLNPARVKPDYVTQTGKDGTFRLDYLRWGKYRLYAVRDEYKNLLYVPQVDQIAMASRDVELTPDGRLVSNIQFRLTKEDTTRPFVVSAEALHSQLVQVRFSEPLDAASAALDAFSIVDTLSGEPLILFDIYSLTHTPAGVRLVTAVQDSGRVYRIMVENVRDTAGNSINPAQHSTEFTASALVDTVRPSLQSVSIRDSVTDVFYDAVLNVEFSEAVRKDPFEAGCSLRDSSGRSVPFSFHWHNAARVSIRPAEHLALRAWYRVQFRLDSLYDYSGNRGVDSLFVITFRTIDPRRFGSVHGTVVDQKWEGRGALFLTAIALTDKLQPPRTLQLDEPGVFTFPRLLEGEYTLSAFVDADGDGRFNYGRSFPFQPAERFAVYPDTIKVRARWPLEGVRVSFSE